MLQLDSYPIFFLKKFKDKVNMDQYDIGLTILC